VSLVDTVKSWFQRAEDVADGKTPVTTADGSERETSTNAQVEGAAGEPYPDER
jgi:hypothetical protein